MTLEEKLSPKNFLSVCDVAMDILEELQMSTKNVVTIPLLRTVIRPGFNILMPGGDVNSGEQYCNYRLKAIEYLKANNYINDFEPSDDNFIFNRWVEITVDREVFNKFYDKLEKIYQKRVVEPAIKEQKQKDFQNEVPPAIKKEKQPKEKIDYNDRFYAEMRAKEIRRQFEELNEKQKEKEILKEEIIEEIGKKQQTAQKINSLNSKPYTEIKNGKGYFKFYKQGENIKIGSKDTRPFRLLQCLCSPFGTHKTIEVVFDAIRLPKDDKDLASVSFEENIRRKLQKIEFTKKELQKIEGLRGKLRYKFDGQKRNMWLELEE